MKRLIARYRTQGIILALCVLLGCVSGISGKELFPIHARPVLPKAMVQPEKTFISCGDDFYCMTPEDLEGTACVDFYRMQSLLNKYEHATCSTIKWLKQFLYLPVALFITLITMWKVEASPPIPSWSN